MSVNAALFLLLFLLFPSLAAAEEGQPSPGPDAQIDKVLSAYGGREKLMAVRATRMEGTVRALLRRMEGRTVRTFSRPNRLKVVLAYPGRPEIRIVDGEKGWRTDGRGMLNPVGGFLLSSMDLQAARANLPWLLDERRGIVRHLGTAAEGGIPVNLLEVPLGEGLTLLAVVEEESGLIIRTFSTLKAPGMATHFETHYTDFRRVNGILFPWHEETFASGMHTGSVTFDSITVDPELAAGEFAPPPDRR
jgi:outer membrane lipoprotein-sorting protein